METIVTEIIKTIKDSDTVIERDMAITRRGTIMKVFKTKLDVYRTTESATEAGKSPSDTARSV